MSLGSKVLFLSSVLLLMTHPAAAVRLFDGKVTDDLSDAPVAGATIVCGEHMTLSDSEGSFRLPEGCETLKVRAAGYRAREQAAMASAEVRLQPFTPRAVYLSFYGAGSRLLRGRALKLIEETELNAVVIDVKGDRGMLSYPSAIPLAKEIGAQEIITLRHLPELLRSLREQGIYTIGRVVVFKDDKLARARPELAVRDGDGEIWQDGEGLAWADPFSGEAREYNMRIAEEAARQGFDEIQFDYIRFPDHRGLVFGLENNEQNRVAAINGFLAEARQRLLPHNVYTSADIFGYVCWNRNDTAIGQHLETLAPHVDYIAPMLYPSGFQHGIGDYRNPVQYPGEIIALSLQRARQRTGLPAVAFRPWLQAFRDYAFDRRPFDDFEIGAQIRASGAFGSNGYMLWNPRNVYSAAGLGGEYEMRAEIEKETMVR